MRYDFIAIPEPDVPRASDPLFHHLVATYASETNKTAGMWRAIPDDLLDFKPHEKVNTIRAILVHQILSERRFFAQFVGTVEPPVEELLPPGDRPSVEAYLDRYVGLAKGRFVSLARIFRTPASSEARRERPHQAEQAGVADRWLDGPF